MKNQPGYVFTPSHYNPPIGHPGLNIFLTSDPSTRLSSVHKARFLTIQKTQLVELLISHPWISLDGGLTFRVYPGRFKLFSEDHDPLYGLCLGGELTITNEIDQTHCYLTSSAPIFDLGQELNTPGMVIATEVEGLLAEREAAWGFETDRFIQRLVVMDPYHLFISLISAIRDRQSHVPVNARGSSFWNVDHHVHTIITTLDQAGQWPSTPPKLEDIL